MMKSAAGRSICWLLGGWWGAVFTSAVTIATVCSNSSNAGSVAQQQLIGLLQVKEKLNDSLGTLHSWNSESLPCDGSWVGVACDPLFSLNVISLNLSNHNLSGTINGVGLAKLPYLETLILSSNELSGGIPKELGELPSLRILDLSFNLLNGSIPGELGQLQNLSELILSSNFLVGEIPWHLGQLQQLTTLYLDVNMLGAKLPVSLSNCTALTFTDFSYNHLVGGIPAEFGSLSQLAELMGSNNDLDGTIPMELGNCSLLYYVGLAGNSLTGSMPYSLGNLSTTLLALDLFDNRLTGSIPPQLCNCRKVYQLQLHYNSLTGTIPSCLGLVPLKYMKLNGNQLSGEIPRNFSTLVRVDLCDNELTGPIPPEFGDMASLYELILYDNGLTGSIPASLGRNGTLTILDIGWNALSGGIPSTICEAGLLEKIVVQSNQLSGNLPSSIGQCRHLRRLLLAQNSFQGSIPIEIGQVGVSLEYVDMSSNKLTGSLPPEISGCSNISALLLSQNMIEGSLPPELGTLKYLEELDLSYNRLTGPILPALEGCSLLFKLDLSNNQLSGSIPPELGTLRQLEILRLQNNLLSGSVPTQLATCISLEALELSSNQLVGGLPGSMLGALVNLQTILNLSYNSFSGQIPPQIGNLVNLEVVDLSHNELQGHIPETLSNIISMVHLNLSYNNLSGTIPHSSAFDKIPANSYLGNPGLVCVFNGTRPLNLIKNCTADGQLISSMPQSNSLTGFQPRPGRARMEKAVVGTAVVTFFFVLTGGVILRRVLKNGAASAQPLEATNEATLGTGCEPWDEFTIKEIVDATRSLSEENVIGRGGFGTVYKTTLETGAVLAVKRLHFQQEVTVGREFQSYVREIESAGRIRHRNIVRLYGYCRRESCMLIIYEYISNGSLGDLLHRSAKPIKWEDRYRIALGTAYGISYLHFDCVPQIVHRDIKSNNILLDLEMEPHLTDFGVAKLVLDSSKDSMSVIAGSVGYIAPEYCYTLKVTEKSDVYSFGVVLFELLTRTSATSKDFPDGMDLVQWVRRHAGPLSPTAPQGAQGLSFEAICPALDPDLQSTTEAAAQYVIARLFYTAILCTDKDPLERPTMREVTQILLRAQDTRRQKMKI